MDSSSATVAPIPSQLGDRQSLGPGPMKSNLVLRPAWGLCHLGGLFHVEDILHTPVHPHAKLVFRILHTVYGLPCTAHVAQMEKMSPASEKQNLPRSHSV